jgi:hypothetical protein
MKSEDVLILLSRLPSGSSCPLARVAISRVSSIQKPSGSAVKGIALVRAADDAAFIVKSDCETTEVRAALLAAELGIAPEAWAGPDRSLIQKFLPGRPLSRMFFPPCDAEQLGSSLAMLLKTMHNAGLYYIDSVSRHLFLQPEGGWRLIDFGAALLVTDPEAPIVDVERWLRESTDSRARAAGCDGSVEDMAMLHDWLVWRNELRDSRLPLRSARYRSAAVDGFCQHYIRPFM